MRAPSPYRLRRFALACAVLMCAPPARASAQDELAEPPEVTLQRGAEPPTAAPALPAMSKKEADQLARELFERGRAAFSDGQYRDAWEHFREAYKLSKRPALLYNVGQSADRMRMDREALEAFRLYLKKLPEAENRREVENRVRWLEERLNGESAPAAGAPEMLDDTPRDHSIDAYAGAEVGAGDPSKQERAGEDDDEPRGPDEVDHPPNPDEAILPDGQPTRTGWYFRLDLGLGFIADSLSLADTSLTSVSASGLFAVGYTITEGVVLGGAITGDWGLSPSASRPGGAQADLESANFSTLAFIADYYLSPRRHGWHLMGGIGIAQLAMRDTSAFVGPEDAGGLALLAGGGHEWTVDRAWAIGAFGRVIVAVMSTETSKHKAFVPSVTCNVVWY